MIEKLAHRVDSDSASWTTMDNDASATISDVAVSLLQQQRQQIFHF
jgi:hypothetical protein